MLSDKEAREAAALSARAAARAKLSAAGQVLPPAPGAPAYLLSSAAPTTLLAGLDVSAKLLAARSAFSSQGGEGGGGNGSGGDGSGGGSGGAVPVPVGWAAAEDGGGRRYYYSRTLARSTWVRPSDASGGPPLPPGWFEAEAGGGSRYFFTAPFTNAQGAQGSLVTWERPTTAPFAPPA